MQNTFAVVDDHDMFCALVAQDLEASLQMKCVGKYLSAPDAIAKLPDLRPDVVVIDWHLGDADADSVLEALKVHLPATRWVLCTSSTGPYVLIRAAQLGFHGIVHKMARAEELRQAVSEVLRGQRFVCHYANKLMMGVVMQGYKERLTPEELDLLQWLASGLGKGEIAAMLGVSSKTVANRASELKAKLGVTEEAQLTIKAIELGVLRSP